MFSLRPFKHLLPNYYLRGRLEKKEPFWGLSTVRESPDEMIHDSVVTGTPSDQSSKRGETQGWRRQMNLYGQYYTHCRNHKNVCVVPSTVIQSCCDNSRMRNSLSVTGLVPLYCAKWLSETTRRFLSQWSACPHLSLVSVSTGSHDRVSFTTICSVSIKFFSEKYVLC